METTIRLNVETKDKLGEFREHKGESYDGLVRKLIFIAKMCENEPKLSQETLKDIRKARKRIQSGEFYGEDEAKKILGL